MDTTIIVMIGTFIFSIVGYLLKRNISQMKELEDGLRLTQSKLAVLEKDYEIQITHLSDKLDDLYDAVKDLTKEIKELNTKIKN